MKIFVRIIFFIFALLLISCSGNKDKVSIIKEKDIELQMIDSYKEGMKAFNDGDVLYAAQKFNEAELLYPQSDWAPRSALMAAYSYYAQDYYGDAIYELNRFLKTYPYDPKVDYAHFLLAMCYYEKIVDEKKDLGPLTEARKKFIFIIEKYPNTDFALDAQFKLDLIYDVLASKEMYIGKHYVKKEKWIPAINRLKLIIRDYESTVYVEEALHRLVEVNYKIGLEDEAKKYAVLLGHNYPESNWFLQSYKIFEKKEINTKDKILKNNKTKPKKLKSIF